MLRGFLLPIRCYIKGCLRPLSEESQFYEQSESRVMLLRGSQNKVSSCLRDIRFSPSTRDKLLLKGTFSRPYPAKFVNNMCTKTNKKIHRVIKTFDFFVNK